MIFWGKTKKMNFKIFINEKDINSRLLLFVRCSRFK